ncbi:tripartite tricarboxylate transporter substrate-binding protein [Aurantimonas sp. A2-1-M11]|uniref:Bug family tripartite tricarboxylate transporter substrate binding protein n=1 Tax=Aurantimonas sp. A2-1-M11 TaxID=3113712 RepID=UPI002F95606F
MNFPRTPRTVLSTLLTGALALGASSLAFPSIASAQESPAFTDACSVDRLTLVNPFNPGGSSDRMARAIAAFLPHEIGDTPVTVVNKPGGSGALGHSWFRQQPDDGSFALVSPVNPYLISNILRGQGNLEWDDFAFVNGQWQDYYVLMVPKEQPFQTAQELVDFIKENPGEASSAIIVGDGGHLSTVIMLERLGLPADAVNFITYDGGGPMRTALAGDQVTFSVISGLGSDVIKDEVRPLAVFRTEPAEMWDAPLINDVLADYDVEIPVLAADLRTFAVRASFKEKNPECYEALVGAYRRMLERDDFKKFIASSQIDGMWMGPEATQKSLDESFEIFEQNIDSLTQ